MDEASAHDVYIFAAVTAHRGNVQAATVLVGACDAAFELVGVAREPPAEEARNDVLRRAQAELGPDAVQAAQADGESLAIVDAVRYALSID